MITSSEKNSSLQSLLRFSDLQGGATSIEENSKHVFVNTTFSAVSPEVLYGLNLQAQKFVDCKFVNLEFRNSSFRGSAFKNCRFNQRVDFFDTDISRCRFTGCGFSDSKIIESNLNNSVFNDCTFSEIDFYGSSFINAHFLGGVLSDCSVYGVNVWNITMEDVKQSGFIVKHDLAKDVVTEVNDIELASLVNYLADNRKFSSMYDGSNFVLILGNFGPEHKENLEHLKTKLSNFRNYVPILCDWSVGDARNLLELIVLLAGFSRFIVVDLSGPRSVPAELQAILTSMLIPVIPLICKNEDAYSAYSYISRFQWVEDLVRYENFGEILDNLETIIVNRAEKLISELREIRQEKIKVLDIDDVVEPV